MEEPQTDGQRCSRIGARWYLAVPRPPHQVRTQNVNQAPHVSGCQTYKCVGTDQQRYQGDHSCQAQAGAPAAGPEDAAPAAEWGSCLAVSSAGLRQQVQEAWQCLMRCAQCMHVSCRDYTQRVVLTSLNVCSSRRVGLLQKLEETAHDLQARHAVEMP